MRIALFSDTFVPQINGVANTVKNSARALGELGHQVRVYTISKESGKLLTKKSNGLYTVTTLPSLPVLVYPGERFSLPLGFALSDIRAFKPDIIHIHTPFSIGLEGILSAKIGKIPVVGTHHTFFDHYLKHIHLDYAWARKFSWDATITFYNRAHLVISPTESLRDGLVSQGLTKPISVVSNSIDFQVFQNHGASPMPSKEVLKKKFGITGKSLVYMGRVSYEKSIDEVIYAAARVIKKIPKVKLMIVGDGPEKEKLMGLARELNIQENVIFTGFLNGRLLVEALSANDIFITASKSENMPLAVLEAMSVGLPIVAASSLGMREIVEDNGNGFLLPPEDRGTTRERITEAALTLLTNNELREKFSAHSQKLSEKYSEKEITKKLVGIYQQAIRAFKK